MHETGHSKLVLWDNPEESGPREVGGGLSMEGTRVHLWLIHADVWEKLSYYCNYSPIKTS